MGLLISFNTNGILIDEKRAAGLSKYSLTKINISLYGASNETYERLTGCRDGFTRVSRAIDLLQSAGCNVYLNAVLTEENTGDLSAMISYAASRNLLLHSTSYVVPPVRLERADNIHTHRLTPEKAARSEWACKKMIYGESACRHAAVFCAFRNHRAAEKAKSLPRISTCFSGRSEFSVTWQGELQPCVLFPAIREELLSQRFIDAWKKCVLKMETISYPEKCTTCRHLETCPVCYASVYLETRTHDRPPEYLCRFSEEMLKIWEEESKGMNVRSVDPKDLPPVFFSRGCGG